MGILRDRMVEEMKLRNFASRTQKSYVAVMVGLAKHYRQFPDQLTQEQIRTYLLQLQERGLSSSSQNVAISGLRFFYQQVLGWNQEQLFLPPRKRTWRLPEVLSAREVERLLAAAVKLRDRCLLMTAYSAGLRVSELIQLRLSDIHTERPLHDSFPTAARRAEEIQADLSTGFLGFLWPKPRLSSGHQRGTENLQFSQAEKRR